MANLAVRAADKADLPDLLDLYLHLDADDTRCPPDKAARNFEQLLRYPGSAILIGLIQDDLVASCTLVVVPNLTRGGTPYALIENVITRTDHRSQGYGKAMLKVAVELAWAEGCYKAMLLTGSKKLSTLAFYEAAGFEQSKTGFQIRRRAAKSD